MPFLDDIRVKGPYIDYNSEETLPRVRRFVFEHIQNLDKALDRIERARACIRPKSQFCHNRMNIVGFVYRSKGRSLASSKVVKILEWPPCRNITEAKAFLGICVYYQIQVQDFLIVTKPIYRLFKKGVKQVQGLDQEATIDALKLALTIAPALVKIQYGPEFSEIIVGVNVSLDGQGYTIGQLDKKGRRRVTRYDSGLWNKAKRGYNTTKREYRGVLKAFRKLRHWLYRVYFVLETNANVLVA